MTFEGAELWLVDLPAVSSALEALEAGTPRLAPDDEERIARGGDEGSRQERRATHIALRLLIERAFGASWRRVPLSRSPSGKPGLAHAPGAFSLSHTQGLALIGLASRGPIGVDLERMRPFRLSDARRQAIEAAAEALAGGKSLPKPDGARFFQAWVRLEAVAKAEGGGIGSVLTRAGVGRAGPRPPSQTASLVPLAVYDVGVGEGLAAAAALAMGEPPPVLSHLPAERSALEKLLFAVPDRNR